MVWDGRFPIKVTELPEALKRKGRKSKDRENKKCYGTSISDRPEIAAQRMEEGHWEGGTVVGKRAGHEAVVLTLLEKKTENYLAIRIPGKTSEAIMEAMAALRAEYGQRFPQVFMTITADNGSEFARFVQTEAWGSKVFFAHPYTPHGSAPRTSGTTVCSGRSSPRASPLSCSPMRTSLQLLTS